MPLTKDEFGSILRVSQLAFAVANNVKALDEDSQLRLLRDITNITMFLEREKDATFRAIN